MMENASSPGKGYTQAITSENPQLRYTVRDDAATIIQTRMNMPDKEFRKMITQNFSM